MIQVASLEKRLDVYCNIVRDFDLSDKIFFNYENLNSMKKEIILIYNKRPGVSYIPFVRSNYSIKLRLEDE